MADDRQGGQGARDGCAADGSRYKEPAPFTVTAQGQHLTFLAGGADRREVLMELVGSARRSLKLCFYIFVEDAIGTALRDALIGAAKRGVAVDLGVDSFGADLSDEFLAPLLAAGVKFRCFGKRLTQRYLIRNHQKMVIADDARAMFGGFNIEDDYFAPPRDNGWSDLGIALEGSAVAGLVDWFAKLMAWADDEDASFRAVRRTVREWEWAEGDGCRWLVGGPSRHLSSWARCVSYDLDEGDRLDMFMAYFSPPKKLLKRIGTIARKGQTRLIMAAKSDNNATIGASRSLYHYLLGHGAEIYEFTPCKLHTKLIVLDDAVYIGSANFDMRSLFINLEIVLRIEDAALADRMREFIAYQIAASRKITPELHRRRATLWNRIRWNLGWMLVSVIDYTITRRLNLGL
ncbi:phospholipase D-like domain-containing protein [Qipengyuania spongiae]|uniref:Phospholipase D n=1 Tax=Qipengyuania spongiae TaxID=2909673 RepID=A0ABY5SY03_9SPHN|nr:cardiolipin synthase B [Qipengyuania spongiae]UVI39422.1 cardiolipin synthase B [Qipengyuania spongiae]